MRKINYRPGKLMLSAAASLLIALSLGYGWTSENSGLWLVGVALFAAFALAAIRAAIGDRPALAFDERGVTINTLYRGGKYAWHEVGEILVERVAILYFGIIPGSNKDFLCFRIDSGGALGRRYRINARLIVLPAGGLSALQAQLSAARGAAPTKAAQDPGVAGSTSDTSGFDPDAAIARYLAAKEAEAAAAPSVAETTTSPFARGPARPTFGRRTG